MSVELSLLDLKSVGISLLYLRKECRIKLVGQYILDNARWHLEKSVGLSMLGFGDEHRIQLVGPWKIARSSLLDLKKECIIKLVGLKKRVLD